MSHISISKPEKQASRSNRLWFTAIWRNEKKLIFKSRPQFKSELRSMLPGCVFYWNILKFLSTLVWAVQPALYWFTQRQKMYKTGEDIWNSYSALPWKLCWGLEFNHNFRRKTDTYNKDLSWDMHRYKGWVECMYTFNLQYMFPPSLAVRAPRCAAN